MIVALGFVALAAAILAADFGGVGLVIVERESDTEPLRTQAGYPGSPAEQAGIKTNGLLISVDGTNVVSMSLTQAVSMVRGPVGTLLTLEIADSTRSHTNKFTVKRGRVVISNRKVEFKEQ